MDTPSPLAAPAVDKGKAKVDEAGPSNLQQAPRRSFAEIVRGAPPPRGFMADARRVETARQSEDEEADGGWKLVTRRNKKHPVARARPSSSRRPVPADLVGRCFNCLRADHVATICRNAPRCFCCLGGGHQARVCKRPRSPNAADPGDRHVQRRPPKRGHNFEVAVHNPRPGDVVLAAKAPKHFVAVPNRAAGSPTSPGSTADSTPPGSPSMHTLPSPPPRQSTPSTPEGLLMVPTLEGSPARHALASPPKPSVSGDPGRRPRRERRVIPRTEALDNAELQLSSALVAWVAGTRPEITVKEVKNLLQRFYNVQPDEYSICPYKPEDFLIRFNVKEVADRVLHSDPPSAAQFLLRFRRWLRLAVATSKPMLFKVLLAIDNLPAHAWSVDAVQTIISSACLEIQPTPATAAQSDMSSYMLVAWSYDPDLIPVEVECSIPEPVEPFVGRAPPLYLKAEEIIESRRDALGFTVQIRILEVQDFHPRSDSEDEFLGVHRNFDDSEDSDESGADGLPNTGHAGGSSKPWPRVFHP